MSQQTTRHRGAFAATLAGVVDRFGRRPGVELGDADRLDERHVLITGANRGLGKGIALRAARRGATVWMACRSDPTAAVAEVRAAAGHARVFPLPLDLADALTIEGLVAELIERDVTLDVLIANAGVVPASSRTTAAGFDVMFHVNFLGNVALVEALRQGGRFAAEGRAPRLVFVGSESHRSAPPIAWEDFGEPREYGTREVVAEYGGSKLLLHTWVAELARRTEGELEVHHLCPGAIDSDIAREAPRWAKPLLGVAFRLFFQSPSDAARPVLWLAASPEITGQTGVYLHMTQRRHPSPAVLDPSEGARLLDEAHALLARL